MEVLQRYLISATVDNNFVSILATIGPKLSTRSSLIIVLQINDLLTVVTALLHADDCRVVFLVVTGLINLKEAHLMGVWGFHQKQF